MNRCKEYLEKWYGEYLSQFYEFGFSEDIQSDLHTLVALARLRFVCLKHAVPPGKVEAVVHIEFVRDGGMVDSVHVRRHDKQAQNFVDAERKSDVGMVEEGTPIEQDLEGNDCDDRGA